VKSRVRNKEHFETKYCFQNFLTEILGSGSFFDRSKEHQKKVAKTLHTLSHKRQNSTMFRWKAAP
jgi:hypothetical protein